MNFDRYIKNINSFSKEEVLKINKKKVCIIGCGGLGGYVIQALTRFGVENLVIVDGDVFSETNLNRQVFCTEKNIGYSKSETIKNELSTINSRVKVTAINKMITEDNIFEIINGSDLVVDCLDNAQSRINLERSCELANIVLIHGAIAGFYGQVSTIFPGDRTLEMLYKNKNKGMEQEVGNPSFTPALVASLQSCEALKFLSGKNELLRNKLLYIDLINYDFEKIELS